MSGRADGSCEAPRFVLHPPVVRGNQVTFSWSPAGPFRNASFWLQYPDLDAVRSSAGKLTEAYFPIGLALSALGQAQIELPTQIDPSVLSVWNEIYKVASRELFNRDYDVRLVNGSGDPGYTSGEMTGTALFFGGGVESLLSLARMRSQGLAPVLAAFGGPDWWGSDPDRNPDKFRLDSRAADELGLRLVRVRTDFKRCVVDADWRPYLKPGLSMMDAALWVPFFVAGLLPVCEQLGIGQLAQGNEKMQTPREYFCFSPGMTDRLSGVARGVRYLPMLSDLYKEDVCSELYRSHPEIIPYQYSCWHNHRERWCHRCDSCLLYYVLLKREGLDPAVLGLDESRIRENFLRLVIEVAKSGESWPGETWDRLSRDQNLLRNRELRRILTAVRIATFMHRRIYLAVPRALRERLGFPRLAETLKNQSKSRKIP